MSEICDYEIIIPKLTTIEEKEHFQKMKEYDMSCSYGLTLLYPQLGIEYYFDNYKIYDRAFSQYLHDIKNDLENISKLVEAVQNMPVSELDRIRGIKKTMEDIGQNATGEVSYNAGNNLVNPRGQHTANMVVIIAIIIVVLGVLLPWFI